MIRDISEYGQEKKLFYIYNYKHALKKLLNFKYVHSPKKICLHVSTLILKFMMRS